MNKAISFIVLGLMIMSIGAVSAETLIAGTIYDGHTGQITDVVGGATVIVTCDGNVADPVESQWDGNYAVIFDETECNWESELTVSASHPEYGYGSSTGIIHEDMILTWDVGIVNVPLVPEFGIVAGIVTALSAVAVFFVVRKNN